MTPLRAKPVVFSPYPQLRTFPLFQGIEEEFLHGLEVSSRLAEYDKGDIFLEQDKAITRYFVVLEGWCGATRSNEEGQESILQIFRCGDFLPDPTFSDAPQQSVLNFRALTPLKLAMLAPNLVQNVLERSKDFAANMLTASVRRGHELREHIEQLTLRSTEHRLGRFLLNLRMASENKQVIELPFDKALVASYLGIKPETLSRALQYFRDQGFKVMRNHVYPPDQAALCAYCDSSTVQHCLRHNDEACPQKNRKKASLPDFS